MYIYIYVYIVIYIHITYIYIYIYVYIYIYIFVLFCEISVFVGSFRWSQSWSPLPSSTVMAWPHGPGPEVVGGKKKVVGICIILHLGVDVYFGSILQWQIEVYGSGFPCFLNVFF